jgi:hypothetical protein
MNNSPPDKQVPNIHQTPNSSPVDDQDILQQDQQDTTEETNKTEYRFVNITTGTEIPSEQVFHESPDINIGDVVEIDAVNGKKDYFSVDHLVEEDITTVYLIRARNSLWKSLLLLAILGVGWYLVDLILSHIF